ncbi:hypothetical protein [Aestuariibaculum lutulentum]|uniref:Outer membrane protein beta-barrel domain-containing protein n=1 Tax=Aestuariibaculum lutulentum TaxID=2920935 RepID=A0ABS9RET0_9FLAO|nr:hypothetical protein [Aestuariibaculum lutulentum]MCH4551463.1 hypothetical protein [Aestuariibaculum lutulentum]
MKRILLFLSLALFVCTCVFAQEESFEGESEETLKHQVGFLLGHAHVPSVYAEGKKEWKALPSFTLYYNYWLNEKWAVGLHTDIIIENFVVEKNLSSEEGEAAFLEREKPIAPALMAVYKPGEHFSYLLGVGEEFAKGENLFLIRAEVEYAIEMPKEWEFEVSLGHDFRWDAYNTINLGLGVSKKF